MKDLQILNNVDQLDAAFSTPYVTAPSSPGRGPPISGYLYSAPASPVHFMLTNSTSHPISSSSPSISCHSDFDFSGGRYTINHPPSMSSADELFFNGQIRPMNLSSHQILPPLIDAEDINRNDDDDFQEERERNLKLRSGSLRRKSRSTSQETDGEIEINEMRGEVSSRSSSGGQGSKRWVFLKEFLYRNKSEGRIQKFWFSKSFSPVKAPPRCREMPARRLGSSSAQELHYTANRAEREVMRKKTFLPYSQGLLGCLRFSSKSYGAINGFTGTSFNPLYSR